MLTVTLVMVAEAGTGKQHEVPAVFKALLNRLPTEKLVWVAGLSVPE